MNRIFNVIWSITKEKWIVVSEKVKSNGGVPKSLLLSFAALFSILAVGSPAWAIDSGTLPAGGQITGGSGSIVTSGAQMTVNQSSQQMIANWSSFNIGTDASVQFKQPNVSATALNHIADQNPTQILGSLSANGKVFLLNQAGIIFGKNARVDVGGLVASSLNMLDSDFLASRYKFNNSGNAGEILNQGSINIMPGGVVALIGPKVTNEGTITASGGSVAFAAGNQVSLDFTGDGLITFAVDEGAVDALVENKGLVKADGGLVVMTAKAADALVQSAVNNSGIIRANSLEQREGRIMLDAVGGMTTVSGTLDASSTDGKGGEVVATGDRVLVKDGAHLTASGLTGGGEVLVGGNWQGKDTSIHQATGTIVEPGALLEANATDTGNGGTVVAWSDVTNPLSVTRAYGTFEAKGGPNGGNGGRIETSGHWLDVAGISVSASAQAGTAGLWLLDPWDVTISSLSTDFPHGDWSIVDPKVWIPSESGSNIYVGQILGKLMSGTNVTVETGGFASVGGELGIIDVQTDIKLGSTSPINATLKLNAYNSIQLNNFVIGSTDLAILNLEFVTPGSVSGSGSIIGAGSTIFNIGANSTYDGTISGSGRTLTKEGTGTLTLTAKNDFTGKTTISSGTLILGASNVIPFASDLYIDDSGIFDIGTYYDTVKTVTVKGNGSITGTGTLASNSFTFTIDKGINTSISAILGDVDGLSTLEKDGAGKLTLSGENTYSGVTTINGGTISIAADSGIGAAPPAPATGQLVLNNGTLETTGSFILSSNRGITLTGVGTLNTADGTTLTYGGIISGSGGLTKLGAGTLTLLGVNDYSGSTMISEGTLTIGASDVIPYGSDVFVDGTGIFDIGNYNDTVNTVTVKGKGSITGITGTLYSYGYTIDSTSDTSISAILGDVDGPSNLEKDGSGKLTLSGENTYSGVTTINGGTISIAADSGIGAAPPAPATGQLVLNNGTLETTGSFILSSNRGITLTGVGTLNTADGTTLTYSGTISGSGGLTKLGAGTLTLSGANSYDGGTNLNGGTLSLGSPDVLGTTGTISFGGGTLQFTANNKKDYSDRFSKVENQSFSIDTNGQSVTFASAISSVGGTLTKVGDSTLTLTGANAYSGPTTITAGKLEIDGAGRLGVGGTYVGAISNASSLIFNTSASQTLTGIISGSGMLTQSGVGTLKLTGANTYSGPTTITAGTLEIDSAGTLGGGTYAGAISNASSLIFNTSADQTLSGIISGSGTLTKLGTGTLTLTSGNTYTGKTTITGGTLANGRDEVIPDGSAVSVGSGAKWNLAGHNETVGSISGSGDIMLGSGNLTSGVDGSSTTYSGILSGSGGLTQSGGGTLTLSGTNTYSGPTTIKEGAIKVSTNTGLGAGDITVVSGAALELENNVSIHNNLNLSGTGTSSTGALHSINGNNTYKGRIFLLADASIITDAGMFTLGVIDGSYGLSINGAGQVTLGDRVGSVNKLASFSSGTKLNINGGSVTTTGAQTYHDILALGANTTLKGSGITFDSTVLSDGRDNYSLTVKDLGVTIFNGSIGGTTTGEELSSLETFGIDPILNGGSVRTIGAQTYHNNVTLGANTILTGFDITFDSTVQSDGTNYSLTVLDSGSTIFSGAIGGDGTVAGEKLSSLNISSVGDAALKGIQATGPISVVTKTGNLTVDGTISTSDASAKAIQLNAGSDIAAGTATGGNIIIKSGTISVGTGGIATLYTGSVLDSTGLTNLIGSGSGNFRYNSDEVTTNYTKPLNTGLNAIYRESPSVAVALANETIENISGLQNNDPITSIADLTSLGYPYPTVTLIIVPDVHITTKVNDSLANVLGRSDVKGNEAASNDITSNDITINEITINEITSNEITSNEITSNEVTGKEKTSNEIAGNEGIGNEVSTLLSNRISGGLGSLSGLGGGGLALAGTNTYSGGHTITAAIPYIRPEGKSNNVSRDKNNEPDRNSDLINKLLMTGGAVIILGGGSLLLSKNFRFSPNNTLGKHVNVYPHIDYGNQHLNRDILPKDFAGKKEISIYILIDKGTQESQVHGSQDNSDYYDHG